MFLSGKATRIYKTKQSILDELSEAQNAGELDEPCNVSMLMDWVLVGYLGAFINLVQHEVDSKLTQKFFKECSLMDAGPFAGNQKDHILEYYNNASSIMRSKLAVQSEDMFDNFMDAICTQFLTDSHWKVSEKNKELMSNVFINFMSFIRDL